MKTSVIEVRDLLSVLTVDEVEKRFVDMAGVKSATVNFEAKNATVRYDETLLEVADIKVLMHQRGQHTGAESQAKPLSEEKPEPQPSAKPNPSPTSKPAPNPAPNPSATPNAAAVAAAPVKPALPLPAKAPESSAPAGAEKAQAPAAITVSSATTAAPKVAEPNQASASAAQPKNHTAPSEEANKAPGTLGKLTAWVQDAFSGADNTAARPGATAAASAVTGAKTAAGASAKGASSQHKA